MYIIIKNLSIEREGEKDGNQCGTGACIVAHADERDMHKRIINACHYMCEYL